jgi:hypothetical protein
MFRYIRYQLRVHTFQPSIFVIVNNSRTTATEMKFMTWNAKNKKEEINPG